MAKKIRFPLKLADGTQARSIEELKEHFDLESVLEHYKSGKLVTWLRDRYIEAEANAIEALDENAPDFQKALCEVFGIEFSGAGADMEEIAQRQERLARLRQFTDDDEFIQNINAVAFDQEELADLLDEDCERIYLCGKKFIVPASVRNKTYVGINSPAVQVSGGIGSDWPERNITFIGCKVDGLKAVAAKGTSSGISSSDPVEHVSVEIADKIYKTAKFTDYNPLFIFGLKHYETQDYLLWGKRNFYVWGKRNFYAMSKRTGEKFELEQYIDLSDCACYGNTLYFVDEEDVLQKIDISSKKVQPLGFEIGPDTYHDFQTNGRYLVCNSNCEIICIDMELKKRYELKHPVSEEGRFVCSDNACYFISEDGDECILVEFSFCDKVERVRTKLPDDLAFGKYACSCFRNKLFFAFLQSSDTNEKYELGYVDLDTNKYYSISTKDICSEISRYDNGWFYVIDSPDYPIEKLDFQTMEFTTVATQCGRDEHDNSIRKIGEWLYFKPGKSDDPVRVSLYHPMKVEPLQTEIEGTDL